MYTAMLPSRENANLNLLYFYGLKYNSRSLEYCFLNVLLLDLSSFNFRSNLHDCHVPLSCRYNSAFWAPGESRTKHYEEYEVCIALKSTGDLADWTEEDCYEPKGYICKIEGMISNKVNISKVSLSQMFSSFKIIPFCRQKPQ